MNQVFHKSFSSLWFNLAGAISTSVYISKKQPKGATALHVLNWLVAWSVILCILPFIPPKDPHSPRIFNQAGRIIGAIFCGSTIGGTIYVSICMWTFFIESQIHDSDIWSRKTVTSIAQQPPHVTDIAPPSATPAGTKSLAVPMVNRFRNCDVCFSPAGDFLIFL
jgi:hypothetical protein